MSIPLIIHRSYNNRYTHQKMFNACHQKWIELNPNYQVIWYTYTQRDIFVKDFNKRVYNAYKLIKPGAFKADIWRLCIYTSTVAFMLTLIPHQLKTWVT